MKKKYIFPMLFIFAITLFLILFSFVKNNEDEVCFNENCFAVKIADNEIEREQGLMNVESLEKNKGMLFIFPESGNYPFWMKDTLIELDIIWIDENFEVVYIAENQKPCVINEECPLISPNINAKYVLEMNAGLSGEIGLSIGDEMAFNTKSF